jgi:hypothetical protein
MSAERVPRRFRVMRLCDGRPDQGQQVRTRVIVVGEYDLRDVQVPTGLPVPRPATARR